MTCLSLFSSYYRAILRSEHRRMWSNKALSEQCHVSGHDRWLHVHLWRWLVRGHVWRQPRWLRQCDVSAWRHLCGRHCELYLFLSAGVCGSVCKYRGQPGLIYQHFECHRTGSLIQLVSTECDERCTVLQCGGEKKKYCLRSVFTQLMTLKVPT